MGMGTDMGDRNRATATVGKGDQLFQLIVDSIPGLVCTMSPSGEVQLLNRQVLEYFGKTTEELKAWATSDAVHPDDLPRVLAAFEKSIETGQPYDIEHRCRRADGIYRWFQVRALPTRDTNGHITGWYILLTDIEDRKRAEETIRSSEQSLRLIVDNIPGFVVTTTPAGEIELANQQILDYFGRTLDGLRDWETGDVIHPDDLPKVLTEWKLSVETGRPHEIENRLRRFDGVYRWFHVRGLPLMEDGRIIRWYILFTDIEGLKTTEHKLRRSEASLLEAQRLGHTGSWSLDIASGIVFTSPELLRVFAARPDEDCQSPDFWFNRIHPDDRGRVRELFERCVLEKTEYKTDYRLLLPDGTIKHQHSIGYPVLSATGELVEFVGTAMDTTEHVRDKAELERALSEISLLKDQLYNENIALREEINRPSMFEEIVGSSQPLRKVLNQVSRVAKTDSTVLIWGETGTGKELIARAIHRQSKRAENAFVRVNCAAIPPSLVSSELFGHEKGAFTGASHRRVGRFESANGGTIFLDEVGELPTETQIALLRVLQEREFERVGSNQPISIDVRVLTATNRDLETAVEKGGFREDLFYRLNVFPIYVPPLRERVDDIPLLVEYLVGRSAHRVGKRIRRIKKPTMELFKAYNWPGNIRELQNVVERAVILCESETLSVDESWFRKDARRPPAAEQPAFVSSVAEKERDLIEAALRESRGRIAGQFGAAHRLGIPRQTLDSKIAALRIDKYRFKK